MKMNCGTGQSCTTSVPMENTETRYSLLKKPIPFWIILKTEPNQHAISFLWAHLSCKGHRVYGKGYERTLMHTLNALNYGCSVI
jgi:hypothetical protein